jgi:hypothetical protein
MRAHPSLKAWVGDPGHLVFSDSPSPGNQSAPHAWAVSCSASDPTQTGFAFDIETGTIKSSSGLCLDSKTDTAGTLMFNPCASSATPGIPVASQLFALGSGDTITQGGQCLDVYDFTGPVVQLYACNGGINQKFTFDPDGKSRQIQSGSNCIAARPGAPSEGPSAGNVVQLWAKRVGGGAAAALAINGDNVNRTVTIRPVEDLGLPTGTYTVRCVYCHVDLANVTDSFVTEPIESHDSRLLLFTPVHAGKVHSLKAHSDN